EVRAEGEVRPLRRPPGQEKTEGDETADDEAEPQADEDVSPRQPAEGRREGDDELGVAHPDRASEEEEGEGEEGTPDEERGQAGPTQEVPVARAGAGPGEQDELDRDEGEGDRIGQSVDVGIDRGEGEP